MENLKVKVMEKKYKSCQKILLKDFLKIIPIFL